MGGSRAQEEIKPFQETKSHQNPDKQAKGVQVAIVREHRAPNALKRIPHFFVFKSSN